jgi:hypothetical protein
VGVEAGSVLAARGSELVGGDVTPAAVDDVLVLGPGAVAMGIVDLTAICDRQRDGLCHQVFGDPDNIQLELFVHPTSQQPSDFPSKGERLDEAR